MHPSSLCESHCFREWLLLCSLLIPSNRQTAHSWEAPGMAAVCPWEERAQRARERGSGSQPALVPGTRGCCIRAQCSWAQCSWQGLCCLQGLGHFPPGMRKSSPKQDKQCWRTATPRSRGAGHDQQLTLSPCPAAAVSWQCHSPWPSLQPQPSHQSSAQAPGWDQRDMCWKQAVIPKASLNSCEKCYTRS